MANFCVSSPPATKNSTPTRSNAFLSLVWYPRHRSNAQRTTRSARPRAPLLPSFMTLIYTFFPFVSRFYNPPGCACRDATPRRPSHVTMCEDAIGDRARIHSKDNQRERVNPRARPWVKVTKKYHGQARLQLATPAQRPLHPITPPDVFRHPPL